MAPIPGCVDNPDHVVIEISASSLDVTHELDKLEITITASRTSAGDALCEPFKLSYSLSTDDATHVTLPFQLEVKPGGIYDKLIYIRVVGKHYGTTRFKTGSNGMRTTSGPTSVPRSSSSRATGAIPRRSAT